MNKLLLLAEHASLLLMGLFIGASTFAQSALTDPTRPPAGFAAAASNAPNTVAPVEGLVLQSVMRNPRNSRGSTAVISGQVIALGETIGDMRLASVSEHSVQLKGAQGITTLRLTPDAQKNSSPSKVPSGVEPIK